MGVEIITVEVGGRRYTSWKSAEIRTSKKEAARSFQLVVAAEAGAEITAWTFGAGAAVRIYANGDLLLTGYVDRYQPSIEGTKAEITITGRSKTGDLVDASHQHKGKFKGKKPSEIGSELAKPFGIEVTSDGDEEPVDHHVTPGKSVFREIEPLARQQGLTLTGDADGNLRLTNAKKARKHAAAIVEGVNLLKGSADHNWSNRHSSYTVKGQRGMGHGELSLEIEQTVRDAGVGRYRPVVVIQNTDTTKDRAKTTAKNRRDKSAGEALKATITMQGFRDDAGVLWTAGHLVWVESPFLNITQDMLIESVSYTQDEGGSLAVLTICDPRAHGGKKGKGAKSSKDWSQSGDEDDS